ncbi:hypothetical protein [Pedobacter sp. L105]|uniref:hypothetical protein n=1 Tax=Pedobacter sp. L105 TaxID=1641871 RepID=UPI00131BE457|nr:hypothetical protein [Pedobacter sp. L105]
MEINEYIESGVLEAYVLGSASEAEVRELLYLKGKFPQIQEALSELECDMENVAQHLAIIPPSDIWMKIEAGIKEVMDKSDADALIVRNPSKENRSHYKRPKNNLFIDVESTSSHMQIHKIWRWVFGAVFLLGKIFLACAIYFYFENRSLQKEMEQLEIKFIQQKAR